LLASIRNPFLQQVIADPWDRADSDTLSINQKQFEQCLALIDEVRNGGRSTSLLMHGEAGCGKTHLMVRFRSAIESREDARFFAIRLETVASRMWRTIRRSVVTDLLRQDAGGSKTVLLKILKDRDLSALSYSLATVLEHYRAERYRPWCVSWLKGEPLPNHLLAKLDLAVDENEEESLEDQAHRIVLELGKLIVPAVAVFCFDQVEALETFPGDRDGLLAFGKAATALHAELPNALLVSLIQSSFKPRFEEGQSYILDRLRIHAAELHQLTREQATQLLLQRMNADAELALIRTQHPAEILWPITQKQFSEIFQNEPRCAARKLLHEAARFFEAARGSTQQYQTLNEYLDFEYSARLEASLGSSNSSPGSQDTDMILLAGLPVLLSASGRGGQTTSDHKLIDFVIETPGAPIAVCLVNQTHSSSVARRLKKIADSWNAKEFARLRLVRDARLPFSSNAKVTQEALQSLRAKGAKLVRPSAEALAALDALRSVYADAQSGHLAHRGETAHARSVLAWLKSGIPVSLQELVSDLMESANEEAQFASGLIEYLQKQSIVKLEDAADAVGATATEVAAYARAHPTRVGYLAGPPPVLFDPVSSSASVAEGGS
jgi:hypothetical protein